MPKHPFQASPRRLLDTVLIDLQGEIDSRAQAELNAIFTQAVQVKPETIFLNLTEVEYINSTGIALIVTLLAQARQNHIRLGAYGLSPHYQEIFQITRLADFIHVYPDEAGALSSVPASV